MVSAAQSRLIDASLAPAALGSQIDAAIAAKSIQSQRQAGAAVLKLLDNAGIQNGGAEVAADPFVGANLDTTA